MDDPYFKPGGPLLFDQAVITICGTIIALALIVAGVILGRSQPALVGGIAGGIGGLIFFYMVVKYG